MRVITLDENSRRNLLDELLKRSPNHYGEYADRVNAIIEDVKKDGDPALFSYTERFDGVKIDFPTEWVHLRKSNTEPIIRIYAESRDKASAEALATRIMEDIRGLM